MSRLRSIYFFFSYLSRINPSTALQKAFKDKSNKSHGMTRKDHSLPTAWFPHMAPVSSHVSSLTKTLKCLLHSYFRESCFLWFSFRVMRATKGLKLHTAIRGACGCSRIQVKQQLPISKILSQQALNKGNWVPLITINSCTLLLDFNWWVFCRAPNLYFNMFNLHQPKSKL